MEVSRIRRLTQALFISGLLNIVLLTMLFHWWVREVPTTADFELISVLQEKQAGTLADHSNAEALRKLRTMPLEQLAAKLSDTQVVENGYTYRDLALAALVAFHHFDLQRALQGLPSPSQQRLIPYGKNSAGIVLEVVAFPGLSEEHFQAITRFAATEQWPMTAQGLFALLQKPEGLQDTSLMDAFVLTPEYLAVETLFRRTEKYVDRIRLLTLLSQGDWQRLATFAESQRLTQDLSPERRQRFLLDYINNGSKVAAQLLLYTDPAFAVNKIDDAQVAKVLKLLTDKTPEAERYSLVMLTSPRSDMVWNAAAERLYLFAGEPQPEKNLHHHALVRFVPGALAKLAPNIAAVPKQKTPVQQKPLKPVVVAPKKPVKPMTAPKVVKNTPKPKAKPAEKKQVAMNTPKRPIAHKVVEGDSLWKISKKYKVSVDVLKKRNRLASDALAPGTVLMIP